ncbi:MAG TPA: CoA ester lyase [Gaiellaceae bacterium]|nr:CoA ester lyase [Gaiellaceae bacterium]
MTPDATGGRREPARRRSCLVTPASAPRLVASATRVNVDELILDLEDSVAPSAKEAAREAAVEALRRDWASPLRAVRTNAVGSDWFADDLAALLGAGARIDALVLPKVEEPATVREVADALDRSECPAVIEVVIESPRALVQVEAIATSSRRLAALVFGAGDYAASLGVFQQSIGGSDPAYPGDQWHYPRARIAVAASACGLQAIDTPYAAIDDLEGFRASASSARAVGFSGKWVIHPKQIEPCDRVFTPSAAEIAAAHGVLAALGSGDSHGVGALRSGGSMIDAASARAAKLVLARADAGCASLIDRCST